MIEKEQEYLLLAALTRAPDGVIAIHGEVARGAAEAGHGADPHALRIRRRRATPWVAAVVLAEDCNDDHGIGVADFRQQSSGDPFNGLPEETRSARVHVISSRRYKLPARRPRAAAV